MPPSSAVVAAPGGRGCGPRALHGRWGGPLLAAAVAVALYAPTLDGGFTMDDDAAVVGHPVVRGEAPLSEAFSREFWGRPLAAGWSSSYRPLVTLAFAIEQRLAGGPALPRLVGVLSYALLCAGLVVIARGWLRPAMAAAAGVIFAVMPAHAANAASIVGRADTWAALLGLVAVAAALRGGRAGNARGGALAWGSVAALAFLAALLCKESMALLPALLAWLLALTALRADPGAAASAGWRAAALSLAPVGVVGLGYLAWRQAALPVGLPPGFVAADNLVVTLEGGARVLLRLALIADYLGWIGAGLRLCVDHTYADLMPLRVGDVGDLGRLAVGGVALTAAALDGVAAMRGRGPGLVATAALAYLIVGGWVVDLSVIAAERLALWPSAWLALGAAAWCERVWRRGVEGCLAPSWGHVAAAAAVAWAVALAGQAFAHGQEWRERLWLHQASAVRCPAAVHNRLNLSREYARVGDDGRALWHLGVAVAGQRAFPARLTLPAFAREAEARAATADDAAIPAPASLPSAVGAIDEGAYWRDLAAVAARVGQPRAAELAAGFAAGLAKAGSGRAAP